MTKVKCTNCSGTGRVDHFAHIANGVCFVCEGTGKVKDGPKIQQSAWNEAYGILDTMQNKGWLTHEQFDANWDWCIAQNKKGKPSTEILAAVKGSYERHKAKRA